MFVNHLVGRSAGRKALIVVLALTVLAGASPATAAQREAEPSSGEYIVVYRGSVGGVDAETDRQERARGLKAGFRFRHAIKGFSARLSPEQVRRLQADPVVASVTPDRPVSAIQSVALASGEAVPPTGVRRVGAANTAATREASSVNVAVIDTGLDLSHPDLQAEHGTNCVSPGAPAQDDNGHGTHLAGTIGAKNNGSGVVGMAPGTTMYAVKVLDSLGRGSQSRFICGIDWVTANAVRLNIKVANASLGGLGDPVGSCPTTGDPEHRAICNSIAAGVTYAVAAGNSGRNFDSAAAPDTPAAFPEVLTVTAMSDSDGAPGAAAPAPGCRPNEPDDRYASFSNYAATAGGQAHTIAAPGVCIRSTWPGGGYNTISGTSMASPHVAGAVALCLGEGGGTGPCTGLTPAQIIQKLRRDAQAHTTGTPAYGFSGDPVRPITGSYYGYLQPPTAAVGRDFTRVSGRQYTLQSSDGATWQDMDTTNLSLSLNLTQPSPVLLSANADLWTWNAGFNQDIGIDVDGTIAAWKESGGIAGEFSPNAAFVHGVVDLPAGTHTVKLRWKTNKALTGGAKISAGAGQGPNFSPTRLSAQPVPTGLATAASTEQYTLTTSDGATWQDMDTTNLSLPLNLTQPSRVLLSANADLWTWNAGFSQDIGIDVDGTIEAWKESGGFAGEFSPNAAFVHGVVDLPTGAHLVKLRWKTNKALTGGAKISAGAGQGPNFSPTRLSAHLVPLGLDTAVSTQQYQLTASNGVDWQDLDPDTLKLNVSSTGQCQAVLSANADLWTWNTGFNQDIGIDVDGTIVAWKESGGFAGTFSPNAAFVHGVVPLPPGPHLVTLKWKTNKPLTGEAKISAGAGGPAPFSPTRLSAQLLDCVP